MKKIKNFLSVILLFPVSAFAWHWMDLWRTPDQQGSQLLQAGNPKAAAQVFKNKNWRGVSHYRSGNHNEAYKIFSQANTSDEQYNAGNAAAFMGQYQDAIKAYDKAIALNSNNTDAITNREIVKKLMQQQKQENKEKQQQKNKTHSNNKKNKAGSTEQKQTSNNDQQNKQQNQNDQQKQNSQQHTSENPKQTPPTNTEKKQENGSTNAANKDLNQASAAKKQQRQEENKNQLLRRLTDDIGGLLQQKFLRDYVRRHGIEENSDQGVS